MQKLTFENDKNLEKIRSIELELVSINKGKKLLEEQNAFLRLEAADNIKRLLTESNSLKQKELLGMLS